MNKGFSAGLIGFGEKRLADYAPVAAKLGFDSVDFNVTEEYKNGAGFIQEQLNKYALKIGGFGLPVDIVAEESKFSCDLKALPDYCKFAADVGNLRCFTWVAPVSNALDYEENFELHKNRLGECARVLEQYGIRFGLEFVGPLAIRKGHKYDFIDNLDGVLELVSAINRPNVGVLVDTIHWDLAGQTIEDFKKISSKDFIVVAHINDAVAGFPLGQQLSFNRELPGVTNVLNIEDFMNGLLSVGYDGPVYVEPFNEKVQNMPFEQAAEVTKIAMDSVWIA